MGECLCDWRAIFFSVVPGLTEGAQPCVSCALVARIVNRYRVLGTPEGMKGRYISLANCGDQGLVVGSGM